MELLNSLTPAETKMLLTAPSINGKEMLRLTVCDLILKKVLTIVEVSKPTRGVRNERIQKYVRIGSQFQSYQQAPHEALVLDTFNRKEDIQILLVHFITSIAEGAKSNWNFYRKYILGTVFWKTYFKSGLFYKLFGFVQLNSKGKQAQSDLKSYIEELNSIIPDLEKNSPQELAKLYEKIGAHIFLSSNIDFESLKEIDDYLPEKKKKLISSSDFDLHDTSDFLLLSIMNTFFIEGFDKHYESNDTSWSPFNSDDFGWSDSDSTSTGCSGCSGCSGCGGCN
jgi:hypothetical protein